MITASEARELEEMILKDTYSLYDGWCKSLGLTKNIKNAIECRESCTTLKLLVGEGGKLDPLGKYNIKDLQSYLEYLGYKVTYNNRYSNTAPIVVKISWAE